MNNTTTTSTVPSEPRSRTRIGNKVQAPAAHHTGRNADYQELFSMISKGMDSFAWRLKLMTYLSLESIYQTFPTWPLTFKLQ
jgi:hypothetical protein